MPPMPCRCVQLCLFVNSLRRMPLQTTPCASMCPGGIGLIGCGLCLLLHIDPYVGYSEARRLFSHVCLLPCTIPTHPPNLKQVSKLAFWLACLFTCLIACWLVHSRHLLCLSVCLFCLFVVSLFPLSSLHHGGRPIPRLLVWLVPRKQ